MVQIHLTERAALEIDEIQRYSVKEWGKDVARKYITNIEQSLDRIRQSPGILQSIPEISRNLKFYQTRNHLLVFAAMGSNYYLVTIKHLKMDILGRIAELEPTLKDEIQILHARLKKRK
jgi:toxin ParE1/3/4